MALLRNIFSILPNLKSCKTPIGPLDTLIAATALAHRATLVTSNAKEFTRVPSLRVETWEEIDWNQ